MGEQVTEFSRGSEFIAATLLVVAVGGAAFWMWRKQAPLARYLQSGDRGRREPNPQRNPGTDPI